MPHVISASRRTDIPAFYVDWFINRLRAGYAAVRQPYTGKPFRVSMKRDDISAIVFWSKNYAPLLRRLDQVEPTTKDLFFHFTITANADLEHDVPDYRDACRDFHFLVERYSADKVVWRFDPICITDKLPFERTEERFVQCAELLQGLASRCIISFMHPYKKVLANFSRYTDHVLTDLPHEAKRAFSERLASRAERYGIRLETCCNDHLLSDSVGKAACIDGRRLSAIFKAEINARPAGSRLECACTKSLDIGAYDTCAHGCVYCYANTDKNRAQAAMRSHDPEANSLSGNLAVPEP